MGDHQIMPRSGRQCERESIMLRQFELDFGGIGEMKWQSGLELYETMHSDEGCIIMPVESLPSASSSRILIPIEL
jgi:hypothetical protein